MKVKVVEKEKNDRSHTEKILVAIYETDYKYKEHDFNVLYPEMDKQPALIRLEFTKSTLYISIRKQQTRIHHIVRMHVKCEKLNFSETLTCSINWTDWINIGKLPPDEETTSDGKMHLLQLSVNFCEMRDKTFINLLDDKDFFDVILVSDDKNPGNVAMHRAVLSAHSSKFRSMLLAQYKDALEVKIKMDDVTHQTLLELREYLYVGLLPQGNLLPLLLLAKNYKFDSVMKDCIFEIINMIDSENLLAFRNFAIDNELTELIHALQQVTSDEIMKATYRLEMLKMSQVDAKTCLKKKEAQRTTNTNSQSKQKTKK